MHSIHKILDFRSKLDSARKARNVDYVVSIRTTLVILCPLTLIDSTKPNAQKLTYEA